MWRVKSIKRITALIIDGVFIKLPCEIVVENFFPAFRAIISRELIENHKLSQNDVAKKLGLTQAAVSQYVRAVRGSRAKMLERDKTMLAEIKNFASRIAGGISDAEMVEGFCILCKKVREKNLFEGFYKGAFAEKCDIV